MTVQEVMLKALSGEIHWFRAADILDVSARTLRRWRERYEQQGYVGLVDKRRHAPSVRRVEAPEVERLLRLYRERYRGFNVRHFHQIARREHGVTVSYSFLKHTLQAAGLVKKQRARGRHRRRREPRACFGELLHIDGSVHAWLTLRPTARAVLVAVLDDATKQVLSAQLWPGETTVAIMTALREVITAYGPRWRSTRTGRTGPSIPRRPAARWIGASSPKWDGPWSGSGSSTSPPTRRRRAAAASGSIGRSRIAW
jgi:transposase